MKLLFSLKHKNGKHDSSFTLISHKYWGTVTLIEHNMLIIALFFWIKCTCCSFNRHILISQGLPCWVSSCLRVTPYWLSAQVLRSSNHIHAFFMWPLKTSWTKMMVAVRHAYIHHREPDLCNTLFLTFRSGPHVWPCLHPYEIQHTQDCCLPIHIKWQCCQ